MSRFESIRQGLNEAIDFAEGKRQIKAVFHDQSVEQDIKSEEFDKKFDEGAEDLPRLLDLSKARRVGIKEKLLALRGTVDIDPDWQSQRQMEITETADLLKLDKEEQELLESLEKGEWVMVTNREEEIRRHQDCARNTMEKKCRK